MITKAYFWFLHPYNIIWFEHPYTWVIHGKVTFSQTTTQMARGVFSPYLHHYENVWRLMKQGEPDVKQKNHGRQAWKRSFFIIQCSNKQWKSSKLESVVIQKVCLCLHVHITCLFRLNTHTHTHTHTPVNAINVVKEGTKHTSYGLSSTAKLPRLVKGKQQDGSLYEAH